MNEDAPNPLPRKRLALIVSLSFAQGIVLYALQRSFLGFSAPPPGASLTCAYTLAIFLPLTLLYLLSGTAPLTRRVRIGVWAQALVLAGMAYYTVSLTSPGSRVDSGANFGVFILSAWIFWFLSLTQILALAAPQEERYVRFYRCNQDIIFLGAFAAALTGAFWVLLLVWGQLFKLVGVPLFWDIFTASAFFLPATTTAFGVALTLARHRYGHGTPLTQRLFALFGYLLPLAAGIALAFLFVLLFTGLEKLWSTRFAASLLLWLQILILIFANAAYQDGRAASPYPRWLRRFVTAGLLSLPAFAALTLYALYLRIGEYGWTMDRVWAALITLCVSALVLGYAYAALARGPWMKRIERINLGGAWAVMVLILLAHSPLLSPARISAASQESRLLAGRIDAEKFDYNYLRFDLGQPGAEALARLSEVHDHPQADIIRAKARAAIALKSRYGAASTVQLTPEDFHQRVRISPRGTSLDPSFIAQMLSPPAKEGLRDSIYHDIVNVCSKRSCHLLVSDMNHDGYSEYIFVGASSNPPVFQKKDGRWVRTGTMSSHGSLMRDLVTSSDPKVQDFTQERPVWDDILIGNGRLRFNEVKEK